MPKVVYFSIFIDKDLVVYSSFFLTTLILKVGYCQGSAFIVGLLLMQVNAALDDICTSNLILILILNLMPILVLILILILILNIMINIVTCRCQRRRRLLCWCESCRSTGLFHDHDYHYYLDTYNHIDHQHHLDIDNHPHTILQMIKQEYRFFYSLIILIIAQNDNPPNSIMMTIIPIVL